MLGLLGSFPFFGRLPLLVAAAQLPRGGTRLKKMGTAGEEGRLGIVRGGLGGGKDGDCTRSGE